MSITLEEVAALVREAIPAVNVHYSRDAAIVEMHLGLEKFTFVEESLSARQPELGNLLWTGKVSLNTMSAEANFGPPEPVESESDVAVWLADVCDRMEQDAIKALVKMLRFPDSLDTSLHTLKSVLYHLHIADALDATGRIITGTCESLPPWSGWQTDGLGKARRLTSEDGLSKGGLAYKEDAANMAYKMGFKFHLHSFTPLARSVNLRDKNTLRLPAVPAGSPKPSFTEWVELMDGARAMFVAHLVTHLTSLSHTPALWGTPRRG